MGPVVPVVLARVRSALKRVVPDRYRKALRSASLLGWRVRCPLCGWRFRSFLPGGIESPVFREQRVVGGGWRANAICPHCQSNERERLVYLFLRDRTGIFDTRCRLLHVAPERNLQRVFLARPNIPYVSADIESPLADVKMDLTRAPYRANAFELVICNHVLEHIPDDHRAMSSKRSHCWKTGSSSDSKAM